MSDSVDPMGYSPPGSSVHGISQARILEWVAISFSRGSSRPRDWTRISCIGRQILYHWATWEAPITSATFNCLTSLFLKCFFFFYFMKLLSHFWYSLHLFDCFCICQLLFYAWPQVWSVLSSSGLQRENVGFNIFRNLSNSYILPAAVSARI